MKKKNKELQDKLNIANKTIALQIEEIKKLNEISVNLFRSKSACLDEINRLEVVVEYLENRGKNGNTI